MSDYFSPYDADQPLLLKCSCGKDHAPSDHRAALAADGAAIELRQRRLSSAFEAHANDFLHLLTKAIWGGHPCGAFGTSTEFIQKNPNPFAALRRPVLTAAAMARDPKNRELIAKVIAPAQYLNQPEAVLNQVLTGKFANGLGNIKTAPTLTPCRGNRWRSGQRHVGPCFHGQLRNRRPRPGALRRSMHMSKNLFHWSACWPPSAKNHRNCQVA